jgi:septum site-determining protein MinD
MVRSIGVISAKGGVGKTVVTINLSAALMQLKKNVIVVDADINASGLGLQLGMFHFPLTLNDVLERKTSILEAMYIHSSGMRIIPASLCLRNTKISRLGSVLNDPRLEENIIMVDAPPGMENNAYAVLKACKEVLFVTTPELPSIADVMKSIAAARKNRCKILGLVVNKYKKRSSDQIKPKEIESACGVPVIGVVPDDKLIPKGVFHGVPGLFLNPYSDVSVSFKRIAARISGEEYRENRVLLRRLLWKLKRRRQ